MRIFCILVFILLPFTVQAKDFPTRIISVGGALTEMIYAMGEGQRLIGSDTTSYYPIEATKLPKIGYQRSLSAEGILSLKPDLLVINEEAGPPPVLAQLRNAGLQILKLRSAKSIKDIKENLLSVGQVLGRPKKAADLLRALNINLDRLSIAVNGQNHSPGVLFLMNHGGGTPMVAGTNTSASTLINMAGGLNAVDVYEGYKPLTPEAAVKYAPDVILITTRSLDLIGGVDGLLKSPGIQLTPAGKKRKIIDMDGLLLLGFGPRAAEAALELHIKLQAGT